MKKALMYSLLVALAFATLEPVGSLPVFAGVNAFAITAIRFVIGSALLLPFSIVAVKKRKVVLKKKDWAIISGLGILVICISMNLLQLAIQVVREAGNTPANIAIIFCSNSLITIFFSRLLLKEKLTKQKIAAALMGALGLCFCIDFSGEDGWVSTILAFMAAISFSLYTVLSKKYAGKYSGIIQTGFSFAIGSIVLVISLLVFGLNLFEGINLNNTPYILFLGVVVTGLGYVAFFRGIELWSTMAASIAFFIKPVLTPFMVWLIRGNEFAPTDWKLFVAILFVVIGSVIAVFPVPLVQRRNYIQETR